MLEILIEKKLLFPLILFVTVYAAECDALSVRYATLLEVCTQKEK